MDKSAKSILEIPTIYKYIAQKQWRKLCIFIKLFPKILDLHNCGYYLIHYQIFFQKSTDYDNFRIDLLGLKVIASQKWSKSYDNNEILLLSDNKYNVPLTIKKIELLPDCENHVKDIARYSNGTVKQL